VYQRALPISALRRRFVTIKKSKAASATADASADASAAVLLGEALNKAIEQSMKQWARLARKAEKIRFRATCQIRQS
jgi:hypothetical protein